MILGNCRKLHCKMIRLYILVYVLLEVLAEPEVVESGQSIPLIHTFALKIYRLKNYCENPLNYTFHLYLT